MKSPFQNKKKTWRKKSFGNGNNNSLFQLKRRNRIEILPYEGLYLAQARLQEENDALATENSTLTASNRDLKAETAELSAVLAARAGTAVDSVTVQERYCDLIIFHPFI